MILFAEQMIFHFCRVTYIQHQRKNSRWLVVSSHSSGTRELIIERIKSMVFLCIYCNSPNPVSVSVVDFQYNSSGPCATAFFICPDCHNKFMVKIEDVGKVR